MSGPRVGKCPGCGREVRVTSEGKLVRHRAPRRHAADPGLSDKCAFSGKPAPETRPAQLELGGGA